MPDTPEKSVLIASLGSKPQLVTIAMDLLRRRQVSIEMAIILHTTLERREMRTSVAQLSQAFDEAYPDVQLRLICLSDQDGEPLNDVASEPAAREVFRTLHQEVKVAKRAGRCVHLSIAGGRKIIAVYAMAVAQLFCDSDDHVWHLFSVPALVESRALHPRPGEAVLIRVPVLRWSEISPALTDLMLSDDPFEALRWQEERIHTDAQRKARLFAEQELSPAEEEVVRLMVCEGLTNAEAVEVVDGSVQALDRMLGASFVALSDDLPACVEKAGEIRQNQPVFGSAAPILAGKKSILRIAGGGSLAQI